MARLKLYRNLGLTNALTLGIGTMIGAGIFILPSLAAAKAGPASAVSYLIGGLIAILTALSLSELATGMSKAGGSYYFINRSLGSFFGTITGLGMWMGLIFASAFYMIGFEYYFSYFFNFEITFSILTINTRLVAILITASLVAMNYYGTKGAGGFQNIIVILLMLILVVFLIWGAFHVDTEENLRPFAPEGIGSVVGVAGLVFIGFMGFEVIATVAEEIKEPEKNLWRAMIGSVVIVTIMYVGVMLITTGIVKYDVLGAEQRPVSFTAEIFMGRIGQILITFAALLATISSANASILSASRINLAMGKDRIFHPWANKLHKKHGTPGNAIVLTGILILIFLTIGKVETLAEVAGFMFLITFILVHGCVWVLRRTEPDWYEPSFRSPLFPYTQIFGAVLCVALIGFMNSSSIIIGLLMIGVSILWYYFWSKRKTKVEGEVKKVLEDRTVEKAKEVISGEKDVHGTVLVPFSDTIYEAMKMRLASAIATKKGRIIRLNVVEIPEQTPVESAMDHIEVTNFQQMEKVKKIDSKEDVEKKYRQIIAHNIPLTMVGLTKEEKCDLIFLGGLRKKRISASRIRMTMTNFVLHQGKCDIAVLTINEHSRKIVKEDRVPKLKKILVPFDDNIHTVLALKLARKIAARTKAKVTLLQVSYKKDLKERTKRMEKLMKDYSDEAVKIRPKTITGLSPAKEIITVSGKYDLIIMGASKKWVLNKFLLGTIPDRVMTSSKCPVLTAKKYEPSTFSQLRGRL